MQDDIPKDNEIPFEGLEDFIPNFLADRKKDLVTLKESLELKDFSTIRNIAHQWKGFCDPYGFGPLTNISKDLEQKATQESYSECKDILGKIEAYLNKRTNCSL